MSQSDFTIANAAGGTVRAAINAAIQALATMSAGNSAPGTPWAYQEWIDSANSLKKQRDGSNANWIVQGYSPDTTKYGVFTNNLVRVYVDVNGKVGLGGNTTPGYTLDVTGDVNVSGNFKIGGTNIGGGNASSSASSSVDSELAIFDSTTGKIIKRATGTGYVKVSSGVMQTPAATIPLTDFATQAANTILANATAGTAAATAVALSTQQVIGRLGSNITGITIGTSANNLVQLDGSAKLPAVDGSQLTNLAGVPAVTSLTASSSTTLSFTGLDFSNYIYEYEFEDLKASSNNTLYDLAFSTGGAYAALGAFGAAVSESIVNAENSATITGNADTAHLATGDTSTPVNGRLRIWQPTSSSQVFVRYDFNCWSLAASGRAQKTSSTRTTTASGAITGVQFQANSSGNFTSGKIIMRPIKIT